MTKVLQLLFVCVLFLCTRASYSQGCVAVKNMSSCSLNGEAEKGFQVSLNYRYFRSYKHFVGDHEEKHRVEQGTEVINKDHSFNLGVNYRLNRSFSFSAIIPFMFIDRSSMYEHLGNSYPGQTPPNINNPNYQRFHTQSNGVGDIRLMSYYHASKAHAKTRATFGLGVKLPTGNYKVKDEFHKPEGIVTAVVDQSIQRGDGGTGIIGEVDLTQKLGPVLTGYFQAMYLLNPMNTNGVLRSNNLTTNPSTGQPIPRSNEFSVPDQYLLRLGASYLFKNFQAALGGRMECIPSKDLADKSEGFRRPGYIISVEPSLYYSRGKHTFGVNVPVALERNRTRSQIDIARGSSPSTGVPFHGDAAFADWLISVSYSVKLSQKAKKGK